jgi:hypothetical protein
MTEPATLNMDNANDALHAESATLNTDNANYAFDNDFYVEPATLNTENTDYAFDSDLYVESVTLNTENANYAFDNDLYLGVCQEMVLEKKHVPYMISAKSHKHTVGGGGFFKPKNLKCAKQLFPRARV